VLATTEARRLPPTILSRCQHFDFRPIAGTEIGEALRRILDEERVPADAVEPDALRLLARAADGSLRDALSLLDTALAYGEGRVSARTVEELLGSGGTDAAGQLAAALVRRAAPDALQRIADAATAGLDLALLCQETLEVLRRALLLTVTGSAGPDATGDETARLTALRTEAGAGEADLLLLLRGLLDAEAEMRKSPHPRVDLEIAAVRLCHRPQTATIETVLERLERAEARLRGYGGGGEPASGPVQADLLGDRPEPGLPRPVGVPRPAERAPALAARGAAPQEQPPAGREAGPPARAAGAGPARSAATVWPAIVAEVTRIRPTLGHLLADGVVVGEEDGRLTVAVSNGSKFAQDRLKDVESRELVNETARRLWPGLKDVQLTTGGPPTGLGTPAHPLVQAAIDLFDAEVTQVRPGPGARGDTAPAAGIGGEAP
jgi:DNA polymerase III subunit gamma/tau